MICPTCDSPLRVEHNEEFNTIARRRRTCDNGHVFLTQEIILLGDRDRYPDEVREKVCSLYRPHRVTVKMLSERFDIPFDTINHWLRDKRDDQ